MEYRRVAALLRNAGRQVSVGRIERLWKREGLKGSGWVAVSVGVVPCTGALLVMLFGLANDLVWPAIAMVAAISAGMAFAMSAIGVAALWGRTVAERHFAGHHKSTQKFEIATRLAGSACVLAIGIVLFVLTWFYQPLQQVPSEKIAAREANSSESES